MPAERLQKVLAAAGVASRRGAEAMIAAGRVTVDGRVATLGTQVDPERSVIAVDGRVIGSAAARAYLLLHKPAGVTSTTRGPPRRHDRARPRADGARAGRRAALPGRPARPGLRGPAAADQRRRLGRARAPSAPRRRARVRGRPASSRCGAEQVDGAPCRDPARGGPGDARWAATDERRPRSGGCGGLLRPPPPSSSGTGRS